MQGRGCLGYGLVFGVIMGTGCGGGMCIDGHIRRGLHNIAGEWGHYAVDPHGVPCYCGNKGCVETKISGGGVEAAFYARYGRIISMQSIVQGFRSGDAECVEAFNLFLDDFGRCLGGLISILDPDAVVLGGGLSNIDELYTLGIERVKKYVFCEHMKTPILKNQLGDSAGVYGAAWMGADAIRSSCTQLRANAAHCMVVPMSQSRGMGLQIFLSESATRPQLKQMYLGLLASFFISSNFSWLASRQR